MEFIDIYCERLGPGLMAEPLNALTNLSFLIAAFFAWRLAQRDNALSIPSITLIALVAIIGIGSSLFHTFATGWAMLSDTLPILFYQIAFLYVYSANVIKARMSVRMLLMGGFFVTVGAFGMLPIHWLNGSVSYVPALLFLLALGIWHWKYAANEKLLLLITAGVFILSLTFRSIDNAICPSLPMGTHFLWHILNGVVLYLSTRAYIKNANG